jgi:hypothetical protein
MIMFPFTYMGWLWVVVTLVFFLPVGYGWGYRGWGAPYPSYVQRRRQSSLGTRGAGTFDHQAWGRVGDLVWALIFFDVLFFAVVLFWRR